ncbi:MAG: 50S ribosomal protein L24 [Gammaproteobacteria bacterium]|nr:50S ribosomal protein L24 [Gammaproteobacteria bacterium]
MAKIRKNDNVIIIAGKDKGQQGQVLALLGDRVLVEGINLVKKHQKGNPQKGEQPGIVQKERSIHISNVAILNPETNRADRIKYTFNESGKKVRVFASNQQAIDL